MLFWQTARFAALGREILPLRAIVNVDRRVYTHAESSFTLPRRPLISLPPLWL